jgi:hypothetical protein
MVNTLMIGVLAHVPIATELPIHALLIATTDVLAQIAILTLIADVIRIMIILEVIVMNVFILVFTVLQEVNPGALNVQMD